MFFFKPLLEVMIKTFDLGFLKENGKDYSLELLKMFSPITLCDEFLSRIRSRKRLALGALTLRRTRKLIS